MQVFSWEKIHIPLEVNLEIHSLRIYCNKNISKANLKAMQKRDTKRICMTKHRRACPVGCGRIGRRTFVVFALVSTVNSALQYYIAISLYITGKPYNKLRCPLYSPYNSHHISFSFSSDVISYMKISDEILNNYYADIQLGLLI